MARRQGQTDGERPVKPGLGQKSLVERMQWLKEFAAVDLLAKRLASETLECADAVDAVVGLQQPIQGRIREKAARVFPLRLIDFSARFKLVLWEFAW